MRLGSVQTQSVKRALISASFSLAASVASGLSTRFSTPSSTTMSWICGVPLFRASCSSRPACRRGVPQSEVPAALPAKAQTSSDQVASRSLCSTLVVVRITSAAKASTTSVGIHGVPSRAVMSEGRRSSGCTSRRAATLRS